MEQSRQMGSDMEYIQVSGIKPIDTKNEINRYSKACLQILEQREKCGYTTAGTLFIKKKYVC